MLKNLNPKLQCLQQSQSLRRGKPELSGAIIFEIGDRFPGLTAHCLLSKN